nr:uncharacterized protein LOC106684540 isoform X2 [Halyomorpha halys]
MNRILHSELILVATALCGSAEEVARNSRLRFPSDIPQQVDMGSQLFESETQVLPMVIHGNAAVNTPHMIYTKAPSTINPFGQISHKGYSEGLVLPYYQPPERPQTEFHQTMPPPLRATPYGPPKAVTSNLQGNRQPTIQAPHRNQERQPERHRFGSHRVPLIQQTKQKPQTQYAPKPHYPSSQYHKDIQHQQPDTLFKYSILTNHSPSPKIPHTEKFEQDFFKSHKQPTYMKNKRPANHQKQPSFHHDEDISDFPEDSAEFDQGIPDWQIKGNFYDTPEEHDSYFYKKNKNKNPHSGLSSGNKHHFNSDFSFSHDFSDFPSFQSSKNNKRFPHSKPDTKNKRGEIKAVYEPSQEHIPQEYNFKKYFPKSQNQRDRTKSEDFMSHENFSGEKFFSDYDFPEHFHSQHEDEPINSNFGSEWIPINAPEGVPAKSYDIPPPDLSRGGFKDRNIIRREYPHEREDSNLVYGKQKPSNSEEVVSAVVRVKQ